MRVVVTGGQGKLGQFVVRALTDTAGEREGHQVTVFDAVKGPEEGPIRYLPGDIVDLGQVFQALAGADAVIHLAAVHKYGIAPDDVTLRTNVMGTFNVHEAAYRLGVPRVVLASSESIMGWDYCDRPFLPDYLPVDEDHPVRPQDSYGVSKQLGEAIARSYSAKSDMVTVALRPPWVVAPDEMAALRRNGGRTPDHFVLCNYVDGRDIAEAFRLAIERPLTGHQVFHVCADDSRTAEPLCELFPRLLPAIGDMARELTGNRTATNTARVKAALGWQPRHSWRRPES